MIPWRQLRMYVLYTHRAVVAVASVCMLVRLVCETVATRVLVVVGSQKPNVVEVLVENFCCDVLCEYVCNVVQGTDSVHC